MHFGPPGKYSPGPWYFTLNILLASSVVGIGVKISVPKLSSNDNVCDAKMIAHITALPLLAEKPKVVQ